MSKNAKCTKKMFYFLKNDIKYLSSIIFHAFSVVQGKCVSKKGGIVTLALNQRVGQLVFIQ